MGGHRGAGQKEDEMNQVVQKMFDDGMSDARLRSVCWRGDDLVIELVRPPDRPEKQGITLSCLNACNVKIDIDFGHYVGSPLLFEAKAEAIGTTGWVIQFEFGGAPDGAISFRCTDVVLQE